MVADPREGVWFASGETFVYQARDRWSVFPAKAAVNKLAVDGLTLWIATDDGAIRYESGSRRESRFTMDDGLPSERVSAIAVDDLHVWFGTNKGVLRWRKQDRSVRVFSEADGLPHKAVNDVLAVGRRIWFATRGGLAVYDPDVDGLRAFTAADGLAGEDVRELWRVGDDIWCRTEVGLSRLRVKERQISNWTWAEVGGTEVWVFSQDGDRVWVGTENGLSSFESAGDVFIPFPEQRVLEGKAIEGVEPFVDYLFIVTDKEVIQFHKQKRTLRRFTEADGIPRREGAVGSLLSGSQLTLVFPDGAEVYDVQKDLWVWKGFEPTEGGEAATGYRLWTRMNAEEPYDLRNKTLLPQHYATAEGGAGVGWQKDGRSFDAAALLDYGQLELSGVRDTQAKLEYLGKDGDLLRSVRAQDQFKYRGVEDGLATPVSIMGGEVRAAKSKIGVTVDAGARRGSAARDFLSGPRKEIYTLSNRWILPGSEKVYVDGELLVNGSDYTIIYPAGQLAFLDPERVDDLSVIEVEYEFDLLPKKGLGVVSILDFLPADREVGDWVRAGEVRVVSEESGLYAAIDGAAPKYIDRGWTRSVFAEYHQGSRVIQVAIHDMGVEANADAIFSYDLPPARERVGDRDDVVLDVGLATSFAVKAHSTGFYFELSIDEKSDAAKQSIKLFALEALDRGTNAGAHTAEDLRQLVAAARVAASVGAGGEVGGRVVELANMGKAAPGRSKNLTTGVLDGRWETPVGEAGRLTAYAEAAGTHGDGDDGLGALGRLKFSHPLLEGTLSERWQSAGYEPLGTSATLFGTLRDETRLNATGYPLRWLPSTVFFSREESRSEAGIGAVQQAMARVQLTREKLPTTSVQVGHSLLDDPTGKVTSRLKLLGQTDVDLAQGLLSFLGMKRFVLRALYSLSDATTSESGTYTRGDRVDLARIEARIAPTANESGYALFRTRTTSSTSATGTESPGIHHWELNAGARSASLRGLIPQLVYSVIYDDDRVTGPLPVRTQKGSLGGELGIYPGQWVGALAPVILATRYSLAADDRTENELRTLEHRVHRVDNRILYSGMRKVDVELNEIVEVSDSAEDQHRDARRLELRNRAIWRPVFSSPITFRADLVDLAALNATTVPGSWGWSSQRTTEGAVEWLMRWSRTTTTRVKGTYTRGDTKNLVVLDKTSGLATVQDFVQHRLGPELELRLLTLAPTGTLFLVERQSWYRTFGDGPGAVAAVSFDVSLGAIWSLGDLVYLDAGMVYQRTNCFGGPCTAAATVTPRLFLSAKL